VAGAVQTYFRLIDLSFVRRGSVPRPRRRGLLFCLVFLGGYPIVAGSTQLALGVDHVLFPKFRRTELLPPVFIIGNPRSGTTLLHRMLALDSQFFFFRSWELFFPALVQKRVLDLLGRLDKLLGEPFVRLMSHWEQRTFEEFNRMHKVSLFLPEEDEKILLHILAGVDGEMLFPYGGFLRFAYFDEEVGPSEQANVMDFYEACVRRQAFLRGPDRRLLSKNPWFTGRVNYLHRRYPTARFVYLVRSPLEVVPSMINMGRAMLENSFGITPGPDLDETAFHMTKHFYLDTLDKLDHLPSNRWLPVNYQVLVDQPEQTIRALYERLELPFSDEFAAQLHREAEQARSYQSKHRYSLDSCAISRERIIAELQPVFDRFGFDANKEEVPQAV